MPTYHVFRSCGPEKLVEPVFQLLGPDVPSMFVRVAHAFGGPFDTCADCLRPDAVDVHCSGGILGGKDDGSCDALALSSI